jgi:NADH:ubiquinone oxidoreductase subunit 3 (subunit A)
MTDFLIAPPVVFVILLVTGFVLSLIFGGLAIRTAADKKACAKPYACGQDITNHRVQPDYSRFFTFAFFFTIMDVVALIINTIPKGGYSGFPLAILYLVMTLVCLLILFRR